LTVQVVDLVSVKHGQNRHIVKKINKLAILMIIKTVILSKS